MQKEIEAIKSTIDILDSYNKLYRKYSGGKYSKYEDYFALGDFHDEKKLIQPVLWREFMEKILGFSKGKILYENPDEETGRKPDFIPLDKKANPFIFETKGTNATKLSDHYQQIKEYVEQNNVRWGVITNMRQAEIYEPPLNVPLPEYSFSFLELYRNYKARPKDILEYDNTKRFLAFVSRFLFRAYDPRKKLEHVMQAKPWTGKEMLDPDELIPVLRDIVRILFDDCKPYKDELPKILAIDERGRKEIAKELDAIACDLEPGREHLADIQPATLAKMIKDPAYSKAFDVYVSRIAYFVMTRILMARVWEDIGFIESSLYNGGLQNWYKYCNEEIRKVLLHAFSEAGSRYSWLYQVPNKYEWYMPSENALIDVLYELSAFNLGKLDTDILGVIYEEYVDRVDRKNKGQYYTPREIIKFIWDRVGFTSDENIFRFEDGRRSPRLVFDPATGSGGFLVEAARRIRLETKYDDTNFDDLLEILRAIADGLCGSEISLFAHYITEVNLLIQLTPVIKKMMDAHKHLYKTPRFFTLSTIPHNSLGLHNPYPMLIPPDKVAGEHKKERNYYVLFSDPAKKDVYLKIIDTKDFDYVCANPPYIGEKGHKELFRETRSHYPYWESFYQGKMDYLYFFIELGLSKLKEGGKLGFITTSYWPTADGASKLRKYILNNALIKEIIDFGETKIFEGAPGQHNMVFVLEKCRSYKNNGSYEEEIPENIVQKKKNRIKIVKVKKEFEEAKSVRDNLKKLTMHIEKHIGKKEHSDEYIDVFFSPVKQGELTDDVWLLGGKEVAYRGKEFSNLLNLCEVAFQGVDPKANRATFQNIKFIPEDKIEKYKIKIGDGIFVLTEKELDATGCISAKILIKPLYKNSDIESYVIDRSGSINEFLLYVRNYDDISQNKPVKDHLEKFKEILLSRPENETMFIARPRDPSYIEREKIVVSRWGTLGRKFAYQGGNLYELSDVNVFIPKKNIKENIYYILAILNSQVISEWIKNRISKRGAIQIPLIGKIPIRRIDFDNPKEVKIHDRLVELVDEIIETKKQLAVYNKYYPVRLTRLEGVDEAPEPEDVNIVADLPKSDLRLLRTHPEIRIDFKAQGVLLKGSQKEETLRSFCLSGISKIKKLDGGYIIEIMQKKKGASLVIHAPKELLNYLRIVLPADKGKRWEEISNEVLCPKDINMLKDKKEEIVGKTKALLGKAEKLQAEIDELVYDLYGITKTEQKAIGKSLAK